MNNKKDLSKEFEKECLQRVGQYQQNRELVDAANQFMLQSTEPKYSYNFTWMGRPIIQYPQDIVIMQEIIWEVKPDLIIETGIAHGGSLIFNASMLALLEISGEIEAGQVIGIDIDIREHNKRSIQNHPMKSKIQMIEGSSTSSSTVEKVYKLAEGKKKVLVCLDSNHTHEHVLKELELYAPLVSKDSYCVVFDTIVEDLPDNMYPDRPWGKGNSPKSAVLKFMEDVQLKKIKDRSGKDMVFEVDHVKEDKILITVAPNGFLKRVR